eukprot:m.156435 g.156435  ORF g.156435 m.156435 type:complete len:87 (-) comp14433_c0_seq3:1543-1803(-)
MISLATCERARSDHKPTQFCRPALASAWPGRTGPTFLNQTDQSDIITESDVKLKHLRLTSFGYQLLFLSATTTLRYVAELDFGAGF